ncbi:MAG: hypothetical protein QOH05_3285 [Acetobacteraceae bacterium]|nr:hypothetical protein [Acetobacteraceae bacterium]
MTRSLLRRVHRWIGLALALPLILEALTGLIMAADPFVASIVEIPSANGSLSAPDDLRGMDVAAILATARAAASVELVPVRWRVQPDAVVAVDFAVPGQQQPAEQVAVDAVLDRVVSVRRDPDTFYRWVHLLHETLLLGATGRDITGWFGVGLLLLGLSGIPIWWPPRRRWRTGFTIARGASGWRLQRDLHGAAGIWLIVLLLLQSLSGVTMAFPRTARALVGLPEPPRRADRPAPGAPIDPARAIAAGVAAAEAAMPEALLLDLRLPAVAGRPMMAFLLPPGRWEGSPRAVVTMDPTTARVLSMQDPATTPAGASVLNWLRAVHQGGAAGPAGRVLLCLFGLAMPLFPVTGIAMWVLRRRRRGRAATRAADASVAANAGE